MATNSLTLEGVGDQPVDWSRGQTLRRLLANRPATFGLAVVLLFTIVAAFAPLVLTQSPTAQDALRSFEGPSWQHLMGTDILGRDWFSRLVYGARLSIGLAVATQLIVVAIGISVGLVAGYGGRWADDVLMRLTDLMYSFPDLLFIILLRSVLGGELISLVLAIGLVSWPDLARLMRAQTLSIKHEEYVLASESLGASGIAIVWRHVLPNAIGPAMVVIAFGIPRVIFAEAALSFIGFGVNPPTPSWGSMISEGYSAFLAYPYLVAFPAAAISLLMIGFTLLGDGLRDALDPRSRRG